MTKKTHNTHAKMGRIPDDKNRSGITLILVSLMMAFFSILVAIAFQMASRDMSITTNYRRAAMAFANADAGVRYALSRIAHDAEDGTILFDSSTINVNFGAPSDFTFNTISKLNRLADRRTYAFTVTSHIQTARAELEVGIRPQRLLSYGLFADVVADMKSYGAVYNYYSEDTINPTPLSSSGLADTAGNGYVITHAGTLIDGQLVLGESGGTAASWTETPVGGSHIQGEVITSEAIEADPLGVISGDLALEFLATHSVNNNTSIGIPTAGGVLTGNKTLTAGSYYLTEISLNNGEALTIDASLGPVKIFLTGPADFKNGSTINNTGNPGNLFLYSNSGQDITFYHGSSFRGVVYAPFASVEIKNSADFYGVLWAGAVDIKNSGNVYIDLSTLNRLISDKIEVAYWRDVRS